MPSMQLPPNELAVQRWSYRLAFAGAILSVATLLIGEWYQYRSPLDELEVFLLLAMLCLGTVPYLAVLFANSSSAPIRQWSWIALSLYASLDIITKGRALFCLGDPGVLTAAFVLPVVVAPGAFICAALLVLAWRKAKFVTALPALLTGAVIWCTLTSLSPDPSQAGRWDQKMTKAATGVAASLDDPVIEYYRAYGIDGYSSLECYPLPPSIAAVFVSTPPGFDTLPGLLNMTGWARRPWRLASEIGADTTLVRNAMRTAPDALKQFAKASLQRPRSYFALRYSPTNADKVTLFIVDLTGKLLCEAHES